MQGISVKFVFESMNVTIQVRHVVKSHLGHVIVCKNSFAQILHSTFILGSFDLDVLAIGLDVLAIGLDVLVMV
tara:strand:- start:93 stop:311 length:219 start_codon:yes stop_codon:yes gene_type:complete